MKKRSWIALAAALLLFAAAGFLLLGQRAQPRPETLIRAALQEAEEAARKRDTNGVMRLVSEDYKDASNKDKEKRRMQLTRAYLLARAGWSSMCRCARRRSLSPRRSRTRRW